MRKNNKFIIGIIFILVLSILLLINNKNKYEFFQTENKIPKVIYQLTRDKNNIPYELRMCMNKLKRMNLEYKFILMDDKDCIKYLKKNHNKEILDLYNSIDDDYGPAKADLMRYILLYDNGGVYFDMKSGTRQPLKNLIRPGDEFILSYWLKNYTKDKIGNENGEIPQWFIISSPKHPFLREVINNVIYNLKNYNFEKDGFGKDMVLKITGPYVFTKTIENIIKNNPNIKYRKVDEIYKYLIYTYIQSNKMNAHEKLYKNHYSTLKKPLIIK